MAMNGTTIYGNYTALYARTNYVLNIEGDKLPSHTLTVNLEYKSGIIVYANGKEIYRQYVREEDDSIYAGGTNKAMVERTVIIPSDILESNSQTVKNETDDKILAVNYIVTVGIELRKYNDEEGSFAPKITFENEKYPIERFKDGVVKSDSDFTGECVNIARSVYIIESSKITETKEIEKAFNDNHTEVWTQETSSFPVDRPFIEFTLNNNPTTVLTHFGYVIKEKDTAPQSIELYGMNSNGKYEIIGKDTKNHLIGYKKGEESRVIFGLPDNTKAYTHYRVVVVPQLTSGSKPYKNIEIGEFLMYSCKEVMCPRYLDLNKSKSGVCLNNVRNPLYNYGNTQTCCSVDGKWHNFYDKSKNEEISDFKYPFDVYNIKEKDDLFILPSYKGVLSELTAECKKNNGAAGCGDLFKIVGAGKESSPKIEFYKYSGAISKISDLPVDTYIITVKAVGDEKTVLTTVKIVVSDKQDKSDCAQLEAWPNAMIGERIRLECEDGTIGYRYRTCLEGGKWSEIDKSNCMKNFTLTATKEFSYIRKTFIYKDQFNNFDDLFDVLRRRFIVQSKNNSFTLYSGEELHHINLNNEDVMFEYIKPPINVNRELSSGINVRLTLRVYPYHETSDDKYFEVYKSCIDNIIVTDSSNKKLRILADNDDEIIRPSYPPTDFTYKDENKITYTSGHSFEFKQNEQFTLNSYIEFPSCTEETSSTSCLNDISQVTYLVNTGKLPFEITLFSNGTLSGKLSTIESGNVTIEATYKETKLQYIFIFSSYGCKADSYWPVSPDGTLVTLPCFDKYEGEMNRTCNKDGVWDVEVSSCKDPGVLLRPASNEVFLKFSLESSENVFNDVEFKNLYRTKVSELSGINVNQFLYDSPSDKSVVLIVNSTNQKAAADKVAVENVLKNDDVTQEVKDVNDKYTSVHVKYTGYQQVSGYRKKKSGNDYNTETIVAIVFACVFGFIGVVVICFLCCQIGHFSKALSTPKK